MANYCGQCGWTMNKEIPPNQIELAKAAFPMDLYSVLVEAHSGEDITKMFNEKVKQLGGLDVFNLRDLQSYFDRGFINGFVAGRGAAIKLVGSKIEGALKMNPSPEGSHIEVSKSGKSGFEIVKLYNYPEKNHAIIRLKKGIIENMGLPYDVRHNKPLLAEVRNGVLLLKVIEGLIHEEFE